MPLENPADDSSKRQHENNYLTQGNESPTKVQFVTGVDVAYSKNTNIACSAACILDINSKSILEIKTWNGPVTEPYVAGSFSLRELTPALNAISKLEHPMDVIVCDAHGIAHPQRFGLACRVGKSTGIPTIGCAKNVLTGQYRQLSAQRGSCSELIDEGEIIGSAVRTKTGVKPVFVSVGFSISLEISIKIILSITENYRIPEVLRIADQSARNKLRDLLDPAIR